MPTSQTPEPTSSSSEYGFAHYSMTICGSISLISTGLLIFLYIFSRKSRTFGFRLVLPLFIVDFIWNLNIVTPSLYLFINPQAVINDILCNISGFISCFTTLASFFCTAAITWTLYTFIIRKKPIQSKNPILYFAKFTFAIPFVASFVYGHLKPLESVMCFLVLNSDSDQNTDYVGITIRICLNYIPFVVVFIFDLISVIRISIFLRKNQISVDERKDIQNLLLYPIVLFFSWISIMIERVIEVTNNDDVRWLNEIDLTISTLSGFFNSLVYGYISLQPFHKIRKDKQGNYSTEKSNISELTDSFYTHSAESKTQTTSNNPEASLQTKGIYNSSNYSLTFHIPNNRNSSESN